MQTSQKVAIALVFAFFTALTVVGVLMTLSREGLSAALWAGMQALGAFLAFGAAIWYAKIAIDQTQTLVAQQQLAQKDYIERNKPVVFLDRWEHPDLQNSYHYVIRNVGGGFALNTYFVWSDVPHVPVNVGSLAAKSERRLPEMLNKKVVDAGDTGLRCLLIAEGPHSRTTQWTTTLNYRTHDDDFERGHVVHQTAATTAPQPHDRRVTLEEHLRNNQSHLLMQLGLLM